MRPTSSPSTARHPRHAWLLLAVVLLLLRALIPAGYMLDVADGNPFALAMCDGGGVLRWPAAAQSGAVPSGLASPRRVHQGPSQRQPGADDAAVTVGATQPQPPSPGAPSHAAAHHGHHRHVASGDEAHDGDAYVNDPDSAIRHAHAVQPERALPMGGAPASAAQATHAGAMHATHAMPALGDGANDSNAGHADHHRHGDEHTQHDGPCPFWASLFVALGAMLLHALLASPPSRTGRPSLPRFLLPRLRRRPAQRGARAPPSASRSKRSLFALGA
ncbi:hypothetical protein [Chitinasiproducens palmae]|uniref:DUF2946 domain-containing protein n=1 Tax=Chitinasiproducens palmae TaxID=1770053 RepID=A0A1H2PVA0_9BURK|nr:hypothetical protein [Chitinasiproducens palmae]SDV51191.1 hypothetical protein SAMN05216551_115101 [Chitinasiproducens palmae]